MVTINNARKILQRVDTLPLYLHAYAFHLNMRLERVLPADLLDIASENNLRGVKIHVLDGERFSLGNMDDKELSAFGDKARRLNLDIHIETSASDKASIDEAVAIALKTGASSVRFIHVMKVICATYYRSSLTTLPMYGKRIRTAA